MQKDKELAEWKKAKGDAAEDMRVTRLQLSGYTVQRRDRSQGTEGDPRKAEATTWQSSWTTLQVDSVEWEQLIYLVAVAFNYCGSRKSSS